jgi:hypothetical protein
VLARFETQAVPWSTLFNLTVEQPAGVVRFAKEYGRRDGVMMRGGHDAAPAWEGIGPGSYPDAQLDMVALQAGPAVVKLIVGAAAGPDGGGGTRSARRNVDVVVLTTATKELQLRAADPKPGEINVAVDGMLTQKGEVYARLHNHADGVPMNCQGPAAGAPGCALLAFPVVNRSCAALSYELVWARRALNSPKRQFSARAVSVPFGIEHSSFWIHFRYPCNASSATAADRGSSTVGPTLQECVPQINIPAQPGASSGWAEVGSMLDTLNGGEWTIQAWGRGIAAGLCRRRAVYFV